MSEAGRETGTKIVPKLPNFTLAAEAQLLKFLRVVVSIESHGGRVSQTLPVDCGVTTVQVSTPLVEYFGPDWGGFPVEPAQQVRWLSYPPSCSRLVFP